MDCFFLNTKLSNLTVTVVQIIKKSYAVRLFLQILVFCEFPNAFLESYSYYENNSKLTKLYKILIFRIRNHAKQLKATPLFVFFYKKK